MKAQWRKVVVDNFVKDLQALDSSRKSRIHFTPLPPTQTHQLNQSKTQSRTLPPPLTRPFSRTAWFSAGIWLFKVMDFLFNGLCLACFIIITGVTCLFINRRLMRGRDNAEIYTKANERYSAPTTLAGENSQNSTEAPMPHAERAACRTGEPTLGFGTKLLIWLFCTVLIIYSFVVYHAVSVDQHGNVISDPERNPLWYEQMPKEHHRAANRLRGGRPPPPRPQTFTDNSKYFAYLYTQLDNVPLNEQFRSARMLNTSRIVLLALIAMQLVLSLWTALYLILHSPTRLPRIVLPKSLQRNDSECKRLQPQCVGENGRETQCSTTAPVQNEAGPSQA